MTFWGKGSLAIARAIGLDLTHSQVRYGQFLEKLSIPANALWMELGCGRAPLPVWAMTKERQKLLAARAALLIGVDVDEAILENTVVNRRVYGMGGNLPFPADTFDLVTANMVVEHIPEPEIFLRDIWRVMRPGGQFVFHTPNYLYYLIFIASLTPDWLKGRLVWILERRREEDRFQTHYRLNTRSSIARHAQAAGFLVEEIRVVGSVGTFGSIWLIGWLECLILRVLELIAGGNWRSNLIVSLRKPADPRFRTVDGGAAVPGPG